MTKRELINRVTTVLREKEYRKRIRGTQKSLHIEDDDGNSKDFRISVPNKNVYLSTEDTRSVIEAACQAICEALCRGESVSINSFGTFSLKYVKSRHGHFVTQGKFGTFPGHYLPKFAPGVKLHACAKIYETALEDQNINTPLPLFYDEDENDPDEQYEDPEVTADGD